MIRFSAFLVVVAIGLLVAGVVTSKLLLVYLAIGVSGVALLALAAGVALHRRELFGRPQTADSPTALPEPVPAQASAAQAPARPAQTEPPDSPHPAAGVFGSVSSAAAVGSAASGQSAPSVAGYLPTEQYPGNRTPWSWPNEPVPAQSPEPSAPAPEPEAPASKTSAPSAQPPVPTADAPVPAPEPAAEASNSSAPSAAEPPTVAPSTSTTNAPASEPLQTPAAEAPLSQASAPEDQQDAQPPPAEPSEPEPSKPEPSEPDSELEVTVVPGVPRYHNARCILIRFMGEQDLEKMTLAAAREAGCTPCRACLPDQPAKSPE